MTAEPLDLDALLRAHSHTYPHPDHSTADLCSECDQWAPCTTRRLLAEVDRPRAALITARRDALTEAADAEFQRDGASMLVERLLARAAQEEGR